MLQELPFAFYVALSALFACLGAWVLFARPQEILNRILGAYLVLNAGVMLAFYSFRTLPSALNSPAALTLLWYDVAASMLLPSALVELARPTRLRAWRIGVAAASGALALGTFSIVVLAPELLYDVAGTGESPMFRHLYGVTTHTMTALAVVTTAWIARSSRHAELQRRQAAAIGIAFSVLTAHVSGLAVATFVTGTDHVGTADPSMLAYLTALSCASTAVALPALARAFEGRGRALALLLPLLALATGPTRALLTGIGIPDVLRSYRTLMWAAFAVALATGVVRFGIAGVGPATRDRLAVVTGALCALGAGVLAATGVLLLTPAPPALAAGAALALPAALALSPARAFPRWLTDRLLLDSRDPRVVSERARVYAEALRQGPSRAEELRRLRGELGLTERDHTLLASLVHSGHDEGLLLGRYARRRHLGSGGSAEVWLADDTLLRREVVVKRVRAQNAAVATILREARALGRIRDANVIALYGIEQVGGDTYLVLEHAPGGDLAARLQAGALPAHDARRIAFEVLHGLAAVHAAGIVHADVKPENVLLMADGSSRLADFGLATRAIRTGAETVAVAPAAGSLASMAPEQVLGEDVTSAADVYAAGALAYRLLTGEPYIETKSATELQLRGRILHAPPRLPHPRVSPAIEAVLRRALAKDAGSRQRDARELASELAAAWPEERATIIEVDSLPAEHEARRA